MRPKASVPQRVSCDPGKCHLRSRPLHLKREWAAGKLVPGPVPGESFPHPVLLQPLKPTSGLGHQD